uniref:Kinesin-like protein n=1 Tax=Strigamia maritima TaxID=126957 RepID=T1JH64_STRMM
MADSSEKVHGSTTCRNLMTLYSPAVTTSSKSPMDVFLRVRGFTREETKKKKEKCIDITNDNRILVHLPKDSATYKNIQNGANVKHQFTFSKIFGPDVDQINFYKATVHNTVQRFLWGENCLIFAYGATNSGKTHTVQGIASNPGILPRALDVVFNSIGSHLMDPVIVKPNYFDNIMKLSAEAQKQERLKKENLLRWGSELVSKQLKEDLESNYSCSESRIASSMSSDESVGSYRSYENLANLKDSLSQIDARIHEECKVSIPDIDNFAYSIWISFAEIYNEFVYDLFQPLSATRSKKRVCLKLSDDKNGNVFVKGLQRIHVSSANEAMKLMIVGTKNLRFAATKLNQNSSRSHCIFTVEIIRVPDNDNPRVATISRLSFCDLAGSERYSKTRNTGDRLKEACNINTSLLVLGRCISNLRANQQMNRENVKLIPFRESKLTRLFQNFFTHKTAVSMIVNVSPESGMCDESLHVLKFSALAEKVFIVPQHETKPKRTKASILMENSSVRTSVPWMTSDEDDDESDIDADKDELFDYIEQLQSEIKKIKHEKEIQESKIRKEIADEAAVAVLNVEKFYSEKIREEKEMAEQYAEKRIALCIQQTEAAHKRQKEEDSDDDDYDKEIEEKNKVIKNLELQTKEMHSEIELLKNEIKALRQSNTRLSVSQANYRRKSSVQMFQNSYNDYRKKSSVDVSWASVSSEEGSASLLELESNYELVCKNLAEKGAKLLEANDEISRLNDLINVYEHRLANQADKKKKLTMDNNLKIWKDDIIEEKENTEVDDVTIKAEHFTQLQKSVKNTPKHVAISDISGSEVSPCTPDTVKKLFKPSANILLTSPLDDKIFVLKLFENVA